MKVTPKKGLCLGDWKLIKLLGQGGNGYVWQAQNTTGENAAIKILAKIEGKGKKVYRRFIDEVKITQENSDVPGLMPILDSYLPENIGEADEDLFWYVMPLAEPLDAYLEGKSIEEIAKAILEVGRTLISLHKRGISHRDIKPANILVRDGNYYLADFGLVEYPNKVDITSRGEQIGPKWTIAPEMRREGFAASGKPADVYSLAKTLWILLTGKKDGFDGQYNPEGKNGLRNFKLFAPKKSEDFWLGEDPIYNKPLDDLIQKCTDDDPSKRPSIDEFIKELEAWLSVYKDFQKRNPLEWRDVQGELFPRIIPQRAIWENVLDIVEILNYLGTVDNLNHMLLPRVGGMDLLGARVGYEESTIELIISDRYVFVVKPKRLLFESFGGDWEWNYFRLETGDLKQIGERPVLDSFLFEELVEIQPGEFIDRVFWDAGEYKGEMLPTSSRLICRFIRGNFVIFQKTSTYNKMSVTYDGRHNQLTTDEFRGYVFKIMEIAQQIRHNKEVVEYVAVNGQEMGDVIVYLLDQLFTTKHLDQFSKVHGENINPEI